eukprot:g10224.t1
MQNTSATPATPATAVYRSARPKDLDACLRLWDAHHHLFFMVYETTKLLKKYGLYFFFICVAKKLSNLQQQQQDQQHAETESQSYFFPDPDVLLDRGFQALASALVSWLQRQIVVQQVAPPTLDQVQECTATAVCRILLRTMFDFVAAIAFLHYLHLFVVTLVYRFSVRPALVRSVEASSRENAFPDRVVVCELWPEEEEQQANSGTTTLPSKEKPALLVGVLRARNPIDGSGRAPTTWSLWDCVVAPHLRGTHQVGPGLVRAMAREARNENESRRSAAVSEFRNSGGFTPRTSRVPPMVTKFTCTVLSPPAKTMCRRLGFQFVGSAIHARNSPVLQMLFEKLPFVPWEMGMSVEDAMYAGGASQVVAAEADPDRAGRGSSRGAVRGPAQVGGNFLEQALQDVSARRRQVHLLEHGGVEDAGHFLDADAPRRGEELVEQNAIASPSSRTLGGC